MKAIFEGSLVGVSFEPARSNLINAYENQHTDLELKHRPENKYDINALSVLASNRHIGWVPKPHNKELLKYGTDRLHVEFEYWNVYEGRVVGACVEIGLSDDLDNL
jgi:plasmid replication initiation protein